MAAVTAAKTIKFDDLMKVMKKYTGESRPVLNYVHYNGTHFTATNSHILLRVNTEYVTDIPTDFKLYDPKQMEIVKTEMSYPETSRLIPEYYNTTVDIDDNIKEFHSYLKEVKKVVKKNVNKVMKLEFKQNKITLSGMNKETGETVKGTTSMYMEGDEVTLHLNSSYLDNAITDIKKLSKLSHNSVQLGIVGNMRPIHFKQDRVFDIIILPVRMG